MMQRFNDLGYVSAESDSGQKIEDYLPYEYNKENEEHVSITPSPINEGTFLAWYNGIWSRDDFERTTGLRGKLGEHWREH